QSARRSRQQAGSSATNTRVEDPSPGNRHAPVPPWVTSAFAKVQQSLSRPCRRPQSRANSPLISVKKLSRLTFPACASVPHQPAQKSANAELRQRNRPQQTNGLSELGQALVLPLRQTG